MRDRGYFDCAVVMRFVFDGPLGVPVFPVVGWGEGRCPDGFVWLLPELHAAGSCPSCTRPRGREADEADEQKRERASHAEIVPHRAREKPGSDPG
jgi:hypothetical protein